MAALPCDRYVNEALKLADELLNLANDGEAIVDDDGCAILLGVMRDCAYKIRREAERESVSHRVKRSMT